MGCACTNVVYAEGRAELWERWKSGQCRRISPADLSGGTRAASTGCWLSMEGSPQRYAGELLAR